jgi:hypothetical protein
VPRYHYLHETVRLARNAAAATGPWPEVVNVCPGAARAYVDAIRHEWLPVASDHGHRLIGLYSGTYRHDQVCLLLATDEDARVALRAAGDAGCGYDEPVAPDPRIPAWWARAREFLVGDWHKELPIPFPGTALAPI